MRRLPKCILLECPINRIPRQLRIRAERCVGLSAELALPARSVQPLNTGLVADLELGDELALGDDDSRAFVAAHEWHFDGDRPVAHHGVEIGVADSGVADFDENLVGTGLGDGDLFVDERAADFFGDLGPLSLGDGHFGG